MNVLAIDTIAHLEALRSLALKHQRFVDGFDEWTLEDQKDFEFYCKLVGEEYKLKLDNPPDSPAIFEEVVHKTSQAIENKIAPSNILNSEVVVAYEEHQKEIGAELAEKRGAKEFVARLRKRFGVSETTAMLLAAATTQTLNVNTSQGLEQAQRILDELAVSTNQSIDSLTKLVTTATLHPDIIDPYYVSVSQYVAAEIGASITPTVMAGVFSQADFTILPDLTAQAEAEILEQLGADKARSQIQSLEGNSTKINEILRIVSPTVAQQKAQDQALKEDFEISPIKNSQAQDQAQLVFKTASFIPYLAAKGKQEIKDPVQLLAYQKYLQALAIQYAIGQGLQVDLETQRLILESPLENFFEVANQTIPPSEKVIEIQTATGINQISNMPTQTTTPSPTTPISSTPKNKDYAKQVKTVKDFMTDVYALKEGFSIESVAGFSGKWLELGKIDATMDKYFTDKNLLRVVRMQNFGADLFGKFVAPEAKPLIDLLKVANKAFFLAVDKSPIGWALRWVEQKVRGQVWNNLLLGAAIGIPIGILFGAPLGIALWGSVAYLSHGGNLARLPAKLNAVLSTAGTGLINALVSFLAITLGVFLAIPIVVALILFIVNTSALVVPVNYTPLSGSNTFTVTGVLSMGPGGFLGCWPASGEINQGPPGSTECTITFPDGHSTTSIQNCSHYTYNEQAVDIGAPIGDPIYAAHDGMAYPNSNNPGDGYGIYVKIVPADGQYMTFYAHMLQTAFDETTPVTAGTIIGYVDSTGGFSTGNHLHYEIKDGRGLPTISINAVVPYPVVRDTIGTITTGKFCKDGGADVVPPLGTPSAKTCSQDGGVWFSHCPISGCSLAIPTGGWSDQPQHQNQVCCKVVLECAPPAGYCQPTGNCASACGELGPIAVPPGGWKDCSSIQSCCKKLL